METFRGVWVWLVFLAGAWGMAEKAPLPVVGESQPIAPGQRPAPDLPQIELNPPIPEVKRLEYASNGYIEAAHALVLVDNTRADILLRKAQKVVQRAFEARPSLNVVDVSLYRGGEYAGFGGPLPFFTASVPRERLEEFLRVTTGTLGRYDHLWLNPLDRFYGPFPQRLDELEAALQFSGSTAQLGGERLEQKAASQQGGVIAGRFYHGNPNRLLAALTFDDAPHPLYAPLLLDTLRRAGVRATFFVIGRNALAYPYFVRDMVRDGHEIGNHTFHHIRLDDLDAATIQEEISQANQVIQNLTHQPVRYFRPPGGRYSPTVLSVVRKLGMTLAFWTDDPGDFDNLGQGLLESRLLSHLRPGGIVLLHDNVLQTIQVLPTFLRLAQRVGIRLGTMSNLVGGNLQASR